MDGQIIGENESATAVLDIHPIAPGHAMVLPKSHAANIFELEDRYIEDVFCLVKKTTAQLKKALSPGGFTLGINHGSISGQAIDHLHVHIIPRFADDGGGSIHTVVSNSPEESVEEIAEKIRNHRD